MEKAGLRRKIEVIEDVIAGLEDASWKNYKGGRAKGLVIDPELKVQDPLTWLKNLETIGAIRSQLKDQVLPYSLRVLARLDRQTSRGDDSFILEDLYTGEIRDFTYLIYDPRLKSFLINTNLSPQLQEAATDLILSRAGQMILTRIALFVPKDGQDEKKFANRVAGAIFEEISYQYLKPKFASLNLTLLSPKEVSILYRNLYPGQEIISYDNYNLTFGIKGVTVPDGLIIRESEDSLIIAGVVEYKASPSIAGHNEELLRQQQHLTSQKIAEDFILGTLDPGYYGRLIHSLNPQLAAKNLTINSDIELLYTVPQNARVGLPNAKLEYLPIHSADFRRLLDILKDCLLHP